jgi:hypothetical protein
VIESNTNAVTADVLSLVISAVSDMLRTRMLTKPSNYEYTQLRTRTRTFKKRGYGVRMTFT